MAKLKAGLARFLRSATGAGRKSKEWLFEQSEGRPKKKKSENIKQGCRLTKLNVSSVCRSLMTVSKGMFGGY